MPTPATTESKANQHRQGSETPLPLENSLLVAAINTALALDLSFGKRRNRGVASWHKWSHRVCHAGRALQQGLGSRADECGGA
ncbi:hypothetical protein L484_021350 [Morus notabilis]|uniref:Uncharacterized protein n=1 Tax=Morus notabilis TaxID=981085 RepID=W9RQF3_9ROSA|nr:hypothetical protein L484_021350 [Morus notabilis]